MECQHLGVSQRIFVHVHKFLKKLHLCSTAFLVKRFTRKQILAKFGKLINAFQFIARNFGSSREEIQIQLYEEQCGIN